MIITRNGSFMPNVLDGETGHEIYVVETLAPIISSTEDWISRSVIRLMCPFWTRWSQICSGFDPMLYRIERNPLWNVFLNIFYPVKAPWAASKWTDGLVGSPSKQKHSVLPLRDHAVEVGDEE